MAMRLNWSLLATLPVHVIHLNEQNLQMFLISQGQIHVLHRLLRIGK
jgi:hypothetical protein